MKKLILILAFACTLQGCFFAGAAVGAAAVAGVYDHRSIELTLKDTNIANKISDKLFKVEELRESHFDVTVFNSVVLLTGQTANPQAKEQAGEIAKSTPGVFKVYNSIAVQAPTSALTRTSDTWITTKIRAEMLAKPNLKSSSIKIVTENGTVYLMGILTKEQADIAVDIARRVSGVQKVIKIFEYTEEKQPTPVEDATPQGE